MVMATHDLRLASQIAETVIVLDGGNVVETGPARALFDAPTKERTARFIATLKSAGTAG
jgi:cystine transport system ATP-binding protein